MIFTGSPDVAENSITGGGCGEAVTIRAGTPDPETGKPMSVKTAVRGFLSNMIEHTSRPVAALVNADGEDRGWQLRSLVSAIGTETGRTYFTRNMKDGNLCHVFRVK